MIFFIEILIICILCLSFVACSGEPLFVIPGFLSFAALLLLLLYRVTTGGWLAL